MLPVTKLSRWRSIMRAQETRSLAVSNSNQLKRELHHFHECVHCGSVFRREEYENRALTSGVYLCPKCGLESPLNVVVREADAPKQDKRPT